MADDAKRALKTGMGYVTEQKMEQNYDREEEAGTPRAACDWITAQLGDKFEAYDWKSICTQLRDGVVLCRLINKLLEADGKPPIKFQKKVNSPFVAMTNIENFCQGALSYGLAKEFTFQSGDLWEVRKGPFLNVLNGIHSLGFVANGKGVKPEYTGNLQKDN